MIDNRFSEEKLEEAGQQLCLPNAFFLVPVPSSDVVQTSLLPWLYQQMYQQALQSKQQPKVRDLFAVMN